ncbi:MAG TPA: DUF1801 domain-containing protein [Candidatus Dormibacteraeota bacterium]|jgi:uncharacterized protein YdhG (YjbR/CyaY superfamily)|nr:DUF1801 domain-containing protein [Candidatus Dormibacteraeota bacterium]
MATTNFASVDDYIAAQPAAVQPILQQVRDAIHKGLPGADEVISYQIPAFRLGGTRVIHLAGWKKHFSLYPASPGLMETFKDELAPYQVEKGTIRFPLSQPVPVDLIERLARFRGGEASSS